MLLLLVRAPAAEVAVKANASFKHGAVGGVAH